MKMTDYEKCTIKLYENCELIRLKMNDYEHIMSI